MWCIKKPGGVKEHQVFFIFLFSEQARERGSRKQEAGSRKQEAGRSIQSRKRPDRQQE